MKPRDEKPILRSFNIKLDSYEYFDERKDWENIEDKAFKYKNNPIEFFRKIGGYGDYSLDNGGRKFTF